MNYAHLSALRAHHPAWRLLASPHAPLIVGFLHRVFVVPNTRMMSEADLVEALDDELFALREQLGDAEFPKSARVYLDEWASPDTGWLRKFYPPGSDEPPPDKDKGRGVEKKATPEKRFDAEGFREKVEALLEEPYFLDKSGLINKRS